MIPFHIPYVISHVDAVVTDRLSALEYRADLGDPSAQGVVQQYRSACQSTSNAASLVLMVALTQKGVIQLILVLATIYFLEQPLITEEKNTLTAILLPVKE